jgi:PAS domain S-box-containing protein
VLLGYTENDHGGDPGFWRRLIHPDDRAWVTAEAARTDRTGEPFVADYRLVARDGRTVWIRAHTILIRDERGEPRFWQGACFDITEMKLAEQELARALEMERDASQRLRILDEMKNTFLEAVSHDLRTPLTAILGTALTLDRDDLELSPQDGRELVRRIAANARKLDRLLSDLLDLDRLSRGILEPKRRPLDVSALIRQLVVGTEVLGDRPVVVEGDGVVGVLDAAKVERIVENLLSNAARHTDPGARIWVRVSRRVDGVLIAVEDEGRGVPDQLRAEVFQPFQQGERPKHSPGVGIGLSLVARFAEMHGGRAWVEDREGGGASFKVLLPDSVTGVTGVGDASGMVEPGSPPSVRIEPAEER